MIVIIMIISAFFSYHHYHCLMVILEHNKVLNYIMIHDYSIDRHQTQSHDYYLNDHVCSS